MNHNRNILRFLQSQLIDLYIRPDLGDTKLLDYHKLDQITEIGYKFAKVHITRWRLENSPHLPRDSRLARSASMSLLSILSERQNLSNQLIPEMYMDGSATAKESRDDTKFVNISKRSKAQMIKNAFWTLIRRRPSGPVTSISPNYANPSPPILQGSL